MSLAKRILEQGLGRIGRHRQGLHIEFTGDKVLDKTFREMPEGLQKKGLRKATREVAKITRQIAWDLVPEDTGALRESLKVRARKRTRKYPHTVAHGVITGEDLFKGDTYYGGFLEFGTVDRHTKTKAGRAGGGAYRGRIEEGKFSFLRQALFTFQEHKLAVFRQVVTQWMSTLKFKK